MAGEQGSQYDGKYDDVPWLQILGMFLGLRHETQRGWGATVRCHQARPRDTANV